VHSAGKCERNLAPRSAAEAEGDERGLLAFGDGLATVCGIAWGRKKLPWNPAKSWAGSAAYVVCGTVAAAGLLIWTAPERQYSWAFALVAGGAAALLAAALESVDVQAREFMQASLNWDDVAWIRDNWHGKLYLKGILRADDAVHAADLGFDGVVVSNHGGRQLEYAQATLDALVDIAAVAGDRMEILLDGGVRRGTDVIKALCLGADAVMIGRPYIYGLAVSGEKGASAVLDILVEELERALLLLGIGNIDELSPDLLARRGEAGAKNLVSDSAGPARW